MLYSHCNITWSQEIPPGLGRCLAQVWDLRWETDFYHYTTHGLVLEKFPLCGVHVTVENLSLEIKLFMCSHP